MGGWGNRVLFFYVSLNHFTECANIPGQSFRELSKRAFRIRGSLVNPIRGLYLRLSCLPLLWCLVPNAV